MAILTKAEILGADDLTKELVSVPEWGGDVYVCAMTAAAKDLWEQSIFKPVGEVKPGEKPEMVKDMSNIRAKLVASTVVDESGDLLFTADDIPALGRKSGAALDRVYSVSSRLNAISDQDVEDLAKNSSTSPADSSTSI
jgi:hypothetical protein